MCKSIRAHHRFVGRNCSASNFRKHTAGGKKLLEADARANSKTLLAHGESDNHFLERRISGTFADAVDCAFNLANSRAHRRQGICHGHTEIIMAVCAERDALGIAQIFAYLTEHRAVFFRHSIAHCVR